MTAKKIYSTYWWVLLIIVSIIFVDQWSKIYIKLHFPLSGYGIPPIIDIGFFKLLFVENKGMAMGAKLNDFIPFINEGTAKLFLTLFRLVAIVGLGYWLWDTIKKQSPLLLCLALTLIFAGALGNIIDSVFYGVLFSSSYNSIATFLPETGGYAPLFYGHVVDMLQFPLVEWTWPSWLPIIGGNTFLFFQYIFNIADTAISAGVGIMIVFNKKVFVQEVPKNNESSQE